METKKIFLASSSELKADREQFEIFINRKNKDWINKGIFLELIIWEDFLDAVSQTRLQDEYNKAIRECDIFVMLFFTKVGKYAEEEFETAFGQFKSINKPLIFTYFKDTAINIGSANKQDVMSLWAFQEKLNALGHFYTVYKNIDELIFKFNQQLDKLSGELYPSELTALPLRPLKPEEARARSRYLKDFKEYIENLLQESIHNARFLDLGIADTPVATHLPWKYKNTSSLQEFVSISEAFQSYERRLLLLGDPGSGKSTTLLHIAQQLILEAEKDDTAPIPLFVNLSKFQFKPAGPSLLGRLLRQQAKRDVKDHSFEAWLISEFSAWHGVRRSDARLWIEEGRVAALLDGLDEVNDERRADLVRLLNNTYLQDHPDSIVVVCSRIAEYQPLQDRRETRLQLNGAVTLQPLSETQIEEYLKVARASGLQEALGRDASLHELAQTPLTLSMMTLAYAGLSAAAIPSLSSVADQRHHLMESFVSRMLQRKERRDRSIPFDEDKDKDVPLGEYRYRPDRVNRYLSWLAVRLSVRMQTACSLSKFHSFLKRASGSRDNVLDMGVTRISEGAFLSLLMLLVAIPVVPFELASILPSLAISAYICGSFIVLSIGRVYWKDKKWFRICEIIALLILTIVGFGAISKSLSVVIFSKFEIGSLPVGLIALTSCIAIIVAMFTAEEWREEKWREEKWREIWLISGLTVVGLLVGMFLAFWQGSSWQIGWVIAIAMIMFQMVGILVLIYWESDSIPEALLSCTIAIGVLIGVIVGQRVGVWLVGDLHWIVVLVIIGTIGVAVLALEGSIALVIGFALFLLASSLYFKKEGVIISATLFGFIWLILSLIIEGK